MLKKRNMIETQSETVTTRLTVCNYKLYNKLRNANETQVKRKPERKRNASETQTETEEERNKEKKVNKDNNKISTLAKFISAKDDILNHSKELYPNKDNDKAIADFIESCDIKEYKYKAYDLAFYRWVREDRFRQYNKGGGNGDPNKHKQGF